MSLRNVVKASRPNTLDEAFDIAIRENGTNNEVNGHNNFSTEIMPPMTETTDSH